MESCVLTPRLHPIASTFVNRLYVSLTMKRIILATLLLASVHCAQAATGAFGSYIQILTTVNTVYDMQTYGPTNPPNFGGASLGTVVQEGSSTLHITNASVLTFKNGGGDVTGAQLNWRIYKQGNTPGSFNTAGVNFGANSTSTDLGGNVFSGGGDQEWRGLSSGAIDIDSLFSTYSNASNGTWNLEVFMRAFTNEGDRFSNNGGTNYIATFNVVPEPSRIMLVALGALGLIARRRRK
jgi:hypothetical protein